MSPRKSDAMSVHDNIEFCQLLEKKLIVKCSVSVFKAGIQAKIGSLDVLLCPLVETDFDFLDKTSEFLLLDKLPQTSIAAVSQNSPVPKSDPSIKINALEPWVLAGFKTLQIEILDRNTPQLIHFDQSLELPAKRGPTYFRTFAAIHRAHGFCRVTVTDLTTGKVHNSEIAISPLKKGGREMRGYDEIVVPISQTNTPVRINVSLRFEPDSTADLTYSPYLFIANPSASHSLISFPLRGVYKQTDNAGWYFAHIPTALAIDGPISLVLKDDQQPIFDVEPSTMMINDDWGHTIGVSASRAGEYILCINGELKCRLSLGSANTAIRLPSEVLTGDIIEVEIRDLSGSFTFLKTYVLTRRVLTPEHVLQQASKAPFIGQLAGQAFHRYQSLQAHLKDPGTSAVLKQASYALSVLEGGYHNVKLNPLFFPHVEAPDVSIVIPAHDKVEVTYYGLASLLLAKTKVSFEIILVDDASTDETAQLEKIVSGITIIHNETPQRFLRSCNIGAKVARGKYVVLLNNDIEATAGWLDALIDGFNRFNKVGLVGAKLLYPDGMLQDAGGIVWGSGTPWNYGNRQNAWDPRFTYARQVDYLTGAAMMTTKKIWDEVGGLSNYLEPMYFEDTDFSFKVRDAGYTTWYIPSATVYHFEGMTSGTNTSSGFKKYQDINGPKFKRRWIEAYKHNGTEGRQPDLAKDRGIKGRVLFIDYSTPREDRDAGSYAAIQEIRLVQSLGYKVTFLPQNLAHFGEYTEILQRMGVEVITAPFFMSVQEFLQKRATEFDAAYITRYHVAQDTLHFVRALSPQTKIILNNADLHFLRELRIAIASNDPDKLQSSNQTRKLELEMMVKSDLVLSYNEVEHSVITSHTDGKAKLMTCPWVADVPADVPELSNRSGLSFLGSFAHPPNSQGIQWFVREVMPLLESGGHILSIYGSEMGKNISELASGTVKPVGFVRDIADAFNQHRIFVAPLLSGAGVKGKVLAALAHGIPLVLTPIAAEGIGLRHKLDCFIVEKPSDWVAAIESLTKDDFVWRQISNNARSYVIDRFSFDAGKEKMKAVFEALEMY